MARRLCCCWLSIYLRELECLQEPGLKKKIHSLNIPQTSGATQEEESLPCFCSQELGRFSDDSCANERLCFGSS